MDQNNELIERVVEGLPRGSNVLHTAEAGGTVAVVYEDNGVRRYYAQEFTNDGTDEEPNLIEAAGYNTADKHWYMGERYRSRALWGAYFSEVFWVEGESKRDN